MPKDEILQDGTERKHSPLRILVAEDNGINRFVIADFLERLGYRAEMAGNGREAVNACLKGDYDLIFMDCLMPEMDGYAATACIRLLEKKMDKRRVFISAMTADVMPGTREKCAVSGMDGCLSKPILLEPLKEMIETAISFAVGAPAPASAPDSGQQPPAQGVTGPTQTT